MGNKQRGKHKSEGIKNHLSSNLISLIFKERLLSNRITALYIKELKTLLGKYKQQCRIDVLQSGPNKIKN